MDTRLVIDDGGNPTETRWVSSREIADIYSISVYSVRRAVRAGRLRTREVLPGLIRIDLSSVPIGRNSR